MNKTIFLFILVLFICSLVFAYPYKGNSFSLPTNARTIDFIHKGNSLVYAPIITRVNPNGSIGVKPISGCYKRVCITACQSAKLRDLFLWGCN